MKSSLRLFSFAIAIAVLFFGYMTPSDAATIFQENFDGYEPSNGGAGFPDKPSDPSNLGVPLVSEGADEGEWLGARVGTNGAGSIAQDVGVQRKYRDQPLELNMTPAGRYADDAGLAIRLDLTNYENVAIEFDWRMFKTEEVDRNKFAYYIGDGLGTPNNTVDWSGIYGTFTEVFSRDRVPEPNNLNVDGGSRHEIFSLPAAANGNVVYLVWWLDNLDGASGENDIGKLDNVIITGDPIVPEPASLALFAFGFAPLLVGLRRRGR
jgi:hypothetical protein